jgi:hypothetical protein
LAQLHQAPIPPVKCFSTLLRFPAWALPGIKNVDFHLQVLDLILFSLIYPLTKASSFYSVHTPRPFPSFALFALFVVISLFKSAFRNRLSAHETLDYRALSGFIGFRFSIPLSLFPTRFLTPPFCTKFTILHKFTQRYLHLNPLSTSHLHLNTTLPIPPSIVQTAITQKPVRLPHRERSPSVPRALGETGKLQTEVALIHPAAFPTNLRVYLMDKALWIPIVVLFASALITALVRRHSKDPCLKLIHGSFVYVRLKTGKWIWGQACVYSNALELIYNDGEIFNSGFLKKSYIFYEQNLETIDRIVRPAPTEKTAEHERWKKDVRRIQNPNIYRTFRRSLRNSINMLRDAFAQSFVMIFGAVKKTRFMAGLPIGDDKVGEVGRTLVNAVPNAYEPILEKYLGSEVVVETLEQDKVFEQVGVLQEYSAKYVLTRAVEFLQHIPPTVQSPTRDDRHFDVVFPRQMNSVRHLALRKTG